MSEFIASAEIAIIPNTRDFSKQLKLKLEDATKKPVVLKVTPDTRSFAKQLRTELRAMKLPTANVLVRPDMKGFKAALQAAVTQASKGVTASVGVKPVAGAARAAAAPRGPAPLRSASGRPLSGAAAEAKAEANARIAENAKIEEARRKASIKAHAENLKRIKAEEVAALAAIERERAARLKAAQAQIAAGLVSKTGQPLFGAAAEAKAAALEREKAEAAATASIQKKETAAWAQNVKLDKQRAALDEKNRLKVLADLQAAGLLSSTGKPLTGAARDAKLEAQARVAAQAAAQKEVDGFHKAAFAEDRRRSAQLAREDAANRIAAIQEARAVEARTHLARGAVARSRRTFEETADFAPEGATATARARAALKNTTEAVGVAERAFTQTIGTNDRALQIHAATTLRDARALQVLQAELLKTTAASEKETASASKRQAFGIRGAVSQFATFAGVRGAVLSANAAFIAGTVAAIAFGKAVQSAAQFEGQLAVFRATAGATADEMEAVAAAAERLGRDLTLPGVAASDAAETMASLAKAGLSVEDSLAGARGVLQLATAAAISNAEATELAASAINAFGLAGTDATRVADVLANSANMAQGSITDVSIAMQQASAVARQVGTSFEDTVALLTLLARNGIRGSDAGTSLRVAFTRLVAPTAQAAEALKNLNVAVRDSQGNLRPEVFSDIALAMADMTRAQQDATAKTIFGVDALRAYSIISREGIGSLNSTREGLGRQGTAAELAAARMSGLTGASENLKNQLAALGLLLGQIVAGPLTSFANTISEIIGNVNAVARPIVDLAGDIKGAFDGVKDTIKDATTVSVAGVDIGPLVSIQENIQNGAAVIKRVFGTTVDDVRGDVEGLVAEFNKIGGAVKLDETVKELRKLQTELQGGGEEAEKFSRDIGVFIEQIQEQGADDEVDIGKMKIEIPPEIASGEVGALAARAIKKGAEDEFNRPGGELQIDFNLFSRLKQEGMNAIIDAGAAWRRQFAAEMAKLGAEIRASTGRLNVLAGDALQIEIEGGPNRLRRLLKNAQAAQPELEGIVERERKRLKPGAKSSPALREAQANLKANLDEQERIRQEMQDEVDKAASDAEKARKELQDKLNAADQALLDSFAPAERRVERRRLIAEGTEGTEDDIAAARARKRQLLKQISVIRARFNDTKAAADEIHKRRQEIIEIEQQIREDSKTDIRDILGEQQALAQSIFDLTGNKNPLLKALNAQIAQTKKEIAAAKKAGDSTVVLRTELNRFLLERKNLLQGANGESPDVFVDRLFREAVDQFRRFGSNIATGSGSGIISPQGARGQFASILTGNGKNVTNLTETTAQRTRETALAEEKKQTAYLRIIAGGPRTKFVRGSKIPEEAAKTAVEIGGNVLRGL